MFRRVLCCCSCLFPTHNGKRQRLVTLSDDETKEDVRLTTKYFQDGIIGIVHGSLAGEIAQLFIDSESNYNNDIPFQALMIDQARVNFKTCRDRATSSSALRQSYDNSRQLNTAVGQNGNKNIQLILSIALRKSFPYYKIKTVIADTRISGRVLTVTLNLEKATYIGTGKAVIDLSEEIALFLQCSIAIDLDLGCRQVNMKLNKLSGYSSLPTVIATKQVPIPDPPPSRTQSYRPGALPYKL
jgi:hypothetical protein